MDAGIAPRLCPIRDRCGDCAILGSNEICFLGNADYRGRTMREGSAKKNNYGKSRNGGRPTNINMEG